MALVFIRVELRGNPSGEIYERLHAHMEKRNWYRLKDGRPLPHAMYNGTTNNHIGTVCGAIRKEIESSIWSSAIVFVVEPNSWAMDPP